MGKFKDIWKPSLDGDRKEQRSFLRYAIVATAVFIVIVGFGLFNHDNIVAWVRAGNTLKRNQRLMELYQEKIDELDRKIELLHSDTDSLERYSRENFFFSRPGDDVYMLK